MWVIKTDRKCRQCGMKHGFLSDNHKTIIFTNLIIAKWFLAGNQFHKEKKAFPDMEIMRLQERSPNEQYIIDRDWIGESGYNTIIEGWTLEDEQRYGNLYHWIVPGNIPENLSI